MTKTVFAFFEVRDIVLLVAFLTLLFLAVEYLAQAHLASVGWHELASVSWNG
jgi:hypothetical protein